MLQPETVRHYCSILPRRLSVIVDSGLLSGIDTSPCRKRLLYSNYYVFLYALRLKGPCLQIRVAVLQIVCVRGISGRWVAIISILAACNVSFNSLSYNIDYPEARHIALWNNLHSKWRARLTLHVEAFQRYWMRSY